MKKAGKTSFFRHYCLDKKHLPTMYEAVYDGQIDAEIRLLILNFD